MTRAFFLVIGLLIQFSVTAQIGTWEKKFQNKKLDIETRLDYNDSIMGYYRKFDLDSSMYYAKRHLNYSKAGSFVSGINYAYSVIASLHRYKGEFKEAIAYYELAIEGYKKSNYAEAIAGMYSNIANVYKQQSRYDLAIRNYFKAIQIMKSAQDQSVVINMYSNLAGLYFKLESWEKAAYYWGLSTKVSNQLLGADSYSFGYRGLARIAIEKKHYDQVEKHIRKALEIDQKNENQLQQYEDYLILLKLYAESKNQIKFLATKQQLDMFLHIDNPVNKQYYYEFCGDFYFNTKQFSSAKNDYVRCVELIEEQNNPTDFIEDFQRVKNKLFYASMFSQSGTMHFDLYQEIEQLTQQVNTIKKSRLTQELDAQYEVKETKEKNAHLQERTVFYKELHENNKRQNVLLSVIVGILILFAIYLLYNRTRLQKIKRDLEQSVQEKEFLFKEVNHRVKNNLLIVNSFIGIEKQGKSAEVQRILAEMEARIYSFGLMHELLYKGEMKEFSSLNDYLETLIQFISNSVLKRDATVVHVVDQAIQVNVNKLSYIGLIVNELITNSMKHGSVEGEQLSIEITIHEENNELILHLADNGKGLPSHLESKSIGLKMAEGLTKQLKGQFTCLQVPVGAAFEIRIPNSE